MANRFWVGGTGTWDGSSTTNWATASGGSSGASVPGSADTAVFDGSSGGGTVTVNTTVNIASISMGSFTGTLDFSANNNDVTLQTFNNSGTGTRTFNMGNGTWTITGTSWNALTTTNLTFNPNSSVLKFDKSSSGAVTITFGSATYGTVMLSANSVGAVYLFNGNTTITTLNVTAPNYVQFSAGATTTITTLNANGSSGSQIGISSASSSATASLSMTPNNPSISWASIRGLTCTGGASFAATNSFDNGLNSGITITAPSGGSGGGLLANPGMSGGMVA